MKKDYKMEKKNILKIILIKYFYELENNKLNYCVIGNYEELPKYTTNDAQSR